MSEVEQPSFASKAIDAGIAGVILYYIFVKLFFRWFVIPQEVIRVEYDSLGEELRWRFRFLWARCAFILRQVILISAIVITYKYYDQTPYMGHGTFGLIFTNFIFVPFFVGHIAWLLCGIGSFMLMWIPVLTKHVQNRFVYNATVWLTAVVITAPFGVAYYKMSEGAVMQSIDEYVEFWGGKDRIDQLKQ